MGVKLVPKEDLSPDSSPPKGRSSTSTPPSSTADLSYSTTLPPPVHSHPPFLGKTRRPKGPPAPDDPYWVVERCRLPSYYYRRLPDYYYLPELEAPPTETCRHAAEPSAVRNVAAGRSLAAEAARVEDVEIEAVEESHEE